MIHRTFKIFLIFFIVLFALPSFSQITTGNRTEIDIDYSNPKDYEIGGITITGTTNLDHQVLIILSGLTVGETITIPGDKLTRAIDNLWKQGLFENIKISVTNVQGRIIFFNIDLKERPRLAKYAIHGVKRSQADKLSDEIKLTRGDVVTDNAIVKTQNKIKDYYIEKGFLHTEVTVSQKPDTSINNSVILDIDVKKNEKVKINKINFIGNEKLSDKKLAKSMKNTKEKGIMRIFKSSKFIKSEYKTDLESIVNLYNENGFRDAKIISDSVYDHDKKTINIDIKVYEGQKFYFRNISWVGNTKYKSERLSEILGIKKGTPYNLALLEQRMQFNPSGQDVSSLYMDDGYLFFSAIPVETAIDNDSIDIEIRMQEGKQARINKIIISGNNRTNDHVILREIRTRPGQLFSRSDVIRTRNELAQLGYFNAETIEPIPIPNRENGTVDIEYKVEEASSDQVEVSGGWGGGMIIGTLRLSFTNFSLRNMFNKNAWTPLPSGDGQRFSIAAQTSGRQYYMFNASFTEPWLGGRKPNALTLSSYFSVQRDFSKDYADNVRPRLAIVGASVGLGKRLQVPDDFFSLYQAIGFEQYNARNYGFYSIFDNGIANSLTYQITLSRDQIDAPIYTRYGSQFSLGLQLTPPYSLFKPEGYYAGASNQEKYKWIEYHKWTFRASWFFNLVDNLVLNVKYRNGFLGYYNKDIGYAPFERYWLGGDGLTGYALDGREVIALRGYQNQSLTPTDARGNKVGGTTFNKYSVELRYPFSLNPMATIWGLVFFDAGNDWATLKEYNPFNLYKGAGVGIRIAMPMFGIIGVDYGFGLDKVPGNPKGQLHFSIGQSID